MAKPSIQPTPVVTVTESSSGTTSPSTEEKSPVDASNTQPSVLASGLDLNDAWTGGNLFEFDPTFAGDILNGAIPPSNNVPLQQTPWTSFPSDGGFTGYNADFSGELLGLGQFESLPPFEMIEELYVLVSASLQLGSLHANFQSGTLPTSPGNTTSSLSSTRADTSMTSTQRHTCGLPWVFSMPSGAWQQTVMRSTGPIMMCSCKERVATWKQMN